MSKDESMDIQREVADNISDIKIESIAHKNDMNNKLNTVNQNLQENQKTMESLMTAITTLNTTMKEEGKKNRMANAIYRAVRDVSRVGDVGWCCNERGTDVYSSLITTILTNFLDDKGCYIDTYTDFSGDYTRKEESKKRFRARLKEEITYLTGTIPTIKLTNDRLAIYHG